MVAAGTDLTVCIRTRYREQKGSSASSGKGVPNSQEEILVVPESIGHSLDDLTFVVDAFDDACIRRIMAVCKYVVNCFVQCVGEFFCGGLP